MTTSVAGYLEVGTLAALQAQRCVVVSGAGRTIAVFYHDERVYAVDNRCPHMGFPLQRGTVRDGILTCHWHYARFDLCSGGTFDPFTDDVQAFPVRILEGIVWVNPVPPPRDEVKHWSKRLGEGLERAIGLVIAKAVLGLKSAGAEDRVPLRIGANFATRYAAAGWGPALSILTCTANLFPFLAEEDRPRALYQGLRHIARECAGQPPRFAAAPLPTTETRPEVFKCWFRHFIEVRDAEGAERCLHTAIALELPAGFIAEMVFAAATDHLYLDDGHILDFANKAFELLAHIGWEHAGPVLTSLVPGMARAGRSEELNAWRYPVDLAARVWEAREKLPALYEQGRRKQWADESALASLLLGDDPSAVLDALQEALRAGATPAALGLVAAYAAFLRLARFPTSNEFGDWDTVHNTLTAAHALHQALKRTPILELTRGVFDAAMSLYLDRFLNVPAHRLPDADGGPVDGEALRAEILDCLNRQQQVNEVAHRVSRYLSGGANPGLLLATLGHALLREDTGFHAFQNVEAAFRQYQARWATEPGRYILIALARFLAAHCPTSRAVGQTYRIAWRLHRGEEIHQES